ncbi:MAG: hypothetical protein A2Y38_20260 [Spirochaetes bacterium GWB1_59_5]|nr:MAG: hypothetical protein A2Y38_20260 [Spirochaetes bacterium GWB1_59_5]
MSLTPERLDELALEVARKVADRLGTFGFEDDEATAFARALLSAVEAELKPVAWWNGKETAFFEHETDGPVGEARIPLIPLPLIKE